MNINKIFPSKYVSYADLGDRHVTVTIAHVSMENMNDGRGGQQQKPVIHFEKTDKGMVMNRTNAMIIASLYGPETDNWRGKKITLYAAKVKAFGGLVDAIRVEEGVRRAPAAHTVPPTRTEHPMDHLSDDEDMIDTPDEEEFFDYGDSAV